VSRRQFDLIEKKNISFFSIFVVGKLPGMWEGKKGAWLAR
jgi:hypothetical protein